MNALTDHALKVPRSVTKDARTIQQVLAGIARKYPADLIPGQLEDIPRIAYHIELIAKAKASMRGSVTSAAALDCSPSAAPLWAWIRCSSMISATPSMTSQESGCWICTGSTASKSSRAMS